MRPHASICFKVRQMLAGYWKSLLQAAQKDPRCEAREKSTSGDVLRVRYSEAIERQRSIWVFFSRLLDENHRAQENDHGKT